MKFNLPIIVVEDSKTIRNLIGRMLKSIGFLTVTEVGDGASALAVLKSRSFDLIISDWQMEPMSGYELLLAVRRDPLSARVPFIMVTAESGDDCIAAARDAGVTKYLVKPFNEMDLQSAIETSLEGRA